MEGVEEQHWVGEAAALLHRVEEEAAMRIVPGQQRSPEPVLEHHNTVGTWPHSYLND